MTEILALQELPTDVDVAGEEFPSCSGFSWGCTTVITVL